MPRLRTSICGQLPPRPNRYILVDEGRAVIGTPSSRKPERFARPFYVSGSLLSLQKITCCYRQLGELRASFICVGRGRVRSVTVVWGSINTSAEGRQKSIRIVHTLARLALICSRAGAGLPLDAASRPY